MRSVELRWLSVYVFDTNSLLVDIFLNPLLRSLRTTFCKKKYPQVQVDKQSFGAGEGKTRFFWG